MLHPDGTSETSRAESDGTLSVTFPEGEWKVSGLVIKGARSREPLPRWTEPKPLPRPTLAYEAPKHAAPGKPLAVRLYLPNTAHVTSVRLHYRPVNQMAKFKTLEAKPANPAFVIPAEDVAPQWDLMYYFEVLNDQNTGWFQPDPATATPYYVVSVGN
jgi:hypothetical protein